MNDKFFPPDDNQEEIVDNPSPIDGQIDIGELFIRSDESKEEESPQDFGLAVGQIGFDTILNKEENMKKKDDSKQELLSKLNKSSETKEKNKELDLLKKVSSGISAPKKDLKSEKVDNASKKVLKTEKDGLSKKSNISQENDLSKTEKLTRQKVNKYEESLKAEFKKIKKTNSMEEIEKTSKLKVESKRKTKIESKDEVLDSDIFFQDEASIKTRSEIESLNRDYEDVDRVVGSDVFGNVKQVKKTDVEKVYTDSAPEEIVDGILYKNLDAVLHESMIPYSEHVILDRALPRVEDGLKPVQRRILYTMNELGITPDKPFKKCARIVGDCLGKYHPHGDISVYDALVRLAQPFNCNQILVEGHGNFGSIDGDGAAAMRYTEARLSPLALELLRDLDKNTVKWGLNFDDSLKEPEILPGRFPNLLVNGATGIAVGLATNIPPHNLAECIDGVVAYISNPKITLKEMLKIIKGPDFPTGGDILSNSELYTAYETGRGKIYVRAKMHVEGEGDKKSIVITELPYQVNKASLLQKIVLLKEDEKYELSDIAEVRDESDRDGMRAVIRLKKDANLNKIYKSLLKNTELQGTFGINMVAIAGGKPKQMGLLDIISYYAEYQREIIYRRTKYDLEQAQERAHILQGLIIAIKNIDAVVKIIKTSQNSTEAKARLKEKFLLSDRQAQAILDMRLARLTSLEVYKLENELKELEELIKKYTEIIGSTKKQFDIVKSEMLAIKKQYKSERKTTFAKEELEISYEKEKVKQVEVKEFYLLKTAEEKLKAVSVKNYNISNKELGENSDFSDIITLKLKTNSLMTILAFTNMGNCHKVKMSSINETKYKDKGVDDWSIFKTLAKNEHIVALFNQEELEGEGNLMFYTKQGMIKKTAKQEYNLQKASYQAIKLKDDDSLLVVESEKQNYNIVLVTKQGMVLNAKSDDVPLQGRVSGGVKGIMLASKDYCVSVSSAVGGEGELVVIDSNGLSKRIILATIEQSARYRKGLKINGEDIAFATVVTNPQTICVFDNQNQIYVKSSDLIHIMARTDRGKPFEKSKKLMIVKTIFQVAD